MSPEPLSRPRRVVFACAGWPEEARGIRYLIDRFGDEVVTLTLDIGQASDLDAVREMALEAGALRAHVLEVRDAWLEHYALPVLRAGAMFDGGVLLVRELAAGLVLSSLADVAGMESTSWVAVGTAAAEVEHAFRQTELIDGLRPEGDLALVSPLAMVYEEPSLAATIEVHDSLLGRCARSARPISDEAARATFRATRAADTAPDRAAQIDLLFERGVPAALNGVRMPLAELVDSVDTIAGGQGVGRFTGVLAPMSTSRHAVYCRGEAPALTILADAYDALASHTLPSDLGSLRGDAAARLRRVIREGRWFTPTRLALLAIMDATSASMHGVVTTRLFKGGSEVTRVTEAVA